MSFIGKKILQIRNKSNKQNRPKIDALNFEQSKTVGLFYTWEHKAKMEAVDEFRESLIAEGKEVNVLCFNPLKEDVNCIHSLFGIESLSSLGKIKSNLVEEFNSRRFDYLIVLDFELSEISSHIMSNSNAIYRVGVHSEEALDYFDLLVNVDQNAGTSQLIEQMIKYIKVIRHD